MNNQELEQYFVELGWDVGTIRGQDGLDYLVIRNYDIRAGVLRGRRVDVAIQKVHTVPYTPPPAIHTRPALVDMNRFRTQASGIGPEWQYWSRLLKRQATPHIMETHIATIFSEVVL